MNHICNLAPLVPKEYSLSLCFLVIWLKASFSNVNYYASVSHFLDWNSSSWQLHWALANGLHAGSNEWYSIVLPRSGFTSHQHSSQRKSAVSLELGILQLCPSTPGLCWQPLLTTPSLPSRTAWLAGRLPGDTNLSNSFRFCDSAKPYFSVSPCSIFPINAAIFLMFW